jgi:long-chain acyl-CoA synthetase
MKHDDYLKQSGLNDIWDIIHFRLNRTPDDIIFQYAVKKEQKSVSYRQLWSDICKLGSAFNRDLPELGRLAVLGENSYCWIVAYLAAVLTGRTAVPLDPDLPVTELAALLRRCPADGIYCSDRYLDVAEGLQAQGIQGALFSSGRVTEILAGPETEQLKTRPDPRQVCAILFTSGTTGEPKGVMLTHRNIAADVLNAVRSIWLTGPVLLTLPLHHAFAFSINVLGAILCGAPTWISGGLRAFQKELRSFAPENLIVVPLYVETLCKRIWSAAREQGAEQKLRRLVIWSNRLRRVGIDLRGVLFRSVREPFGGKLKTIICGGAYLDQTYIDDLESFGIRILNGYGITECAPVVSFTRIGHSRRGSVGQPLHGTQVRIIDGEICVRGDQVMAGYYEDEAATAEALQDGWLHTGDLGSLDGDGFLYFKGRKKNLIILSNGENVSAEELENHLIRIGNVDEVLVSEKAGKITAELYAPDRSGVEEAIDQFNRTMPPYKRIQVVYFRDTAFEKTTTQKIKRK